jgi:gamma-glutamylcyclotransferase (GGCT)/AIG2-like uncharacterized protein YtfP
MFYYFAYGSNQDPKRAARRMPGAIALGVATLHNYRLAERLYADVDFGEGASVQGVLYLINSAQLFNLDICEGYPLVYKRQWLEVEFRGEKLLAITYEMTAVTKAQREGKPYPEKYRKICHAGARHYKIKSQFTKKRSKKPCPKTKS